MTEDQIKIHIYIPLKLFFSIKLFSKKKVLPTPQGPVIAIAVTIFSFLYYFSNNSFNLFLYLNTFIIQYISIQ